MPTPGEHKTVQSRILEYAQAIGWTFIPREGAERCREFEPDMAPKDRAKGRSLFKAETCHINACLWRIFDNRAIIGRQCRNESHKTSSTRFKK